MVDTELDPLQKLVRDIKYVLEELKYTGAGDGITVLDAAQIVEQANRVWLTNPVPINQEEDN